MASFPKLTMNKEPFMLSLVRLHLEWDGYEHIHVTAVLFRSGSSMPPLLVSNLKHEHPRCDSPGYGRLHQ